MTSNRFLSVAGLILAGSCISSVPALAQQGAPQTQPPLAGDRRGPPMDGRRGPPNVDERVQRMTADLGLSADQATKVRALLTAERRQADSIFAQRARQQDAERDAMMAVRSGTEKSLASILTPEQRTKHDAMRARGGPDGRGGHGGRPGRPPRRGDDDRGRGPGRGGDDRGRGADRDSR